LEGFDRSRHHHRRREKAFVKDEFAYVLDYMPYGYVYDKHPQHKTQPVAQCLGSKYLVLLEVVPPRGSYLSIGDRIPISTAPDIPGYRVFDKLTYNDLSTTARDNLSSVVEKIIVEKEKVFVEFFNIAQPINIKFHSLELVPGIGKKTVALILEERQKKPFESFDDIKSRVRIDPVKSLTSRIIQELQGDEKYYLFVEPYARQPGITFFNYLEVLYERVGYKDPW